MRKVLLFLLSLTSCLGMTAQGTLDSDGTLEITYNASLTPGASSNDDGWFTIAFKAPNEDKLYTAYQMDIFLPDGIVFDSEDGDACDVYKEGCPIYPFTTDRRGNKTWAHTFSYNLHSDNHATILVADYTNNAPFTSNEGDLFDVYVKATPYAKPGDFQVTITDIKFVSPDETKYLYKDQVLTAGIVSAETSVPVKITAANKISTAIFPISCDVPEGLEVYTTDGVEGEYIKLTKAESITAFTPYILYSENGIDQTLNGTIDAANYPASTSVSDGCITGVLADTQVAAGYVLQNKGEGPKFHKIGATPFKVPAGKCYANPASANAPALAFRFRDNETSGIHGVENTSTKVNNAVYDLQGKQVLTPQSGQIYIINGQKVLKR